MASPFDDLDRKKLDETHKLVSLLVEQVARLEEKVEKNIKLNAKRNSSWGRAYLRRIIRDLREKNHELKGYATQLERQLRL